MNWCSGSQDIGQTKPLIFENHRFAYISPSFNHMHIIKIALESPYQGVSNGTLIILISRGEPMRWGVRGTLVLC